MSRNQNSRFSVNPTNIDIRRSTFKRSSSVKLSFNTGDIIPFYVDEVLPGDTFKVKTSKVVRMQTLITPMMDNMYLDTYYFFVPNRLVWDHWQEFNGENTASAWTQQIEYQVPQVTAPDEIPPDGDDPGEPAGWRTGTIADYMGIPVDVGGISVNALPFRAYGLICSEWFRDENLMDPVYIDTGDTTVAGSNGNDYVTDIVLGGKPYKAAKYHDYFTSALPGPQKGPDVSLGMLSNAKVVGDGSALALSDGEYVNNLYTASTTLRNSAKYGSDMGDAWNTGTATTVFGEKVLGIADKELLNTLGITSGLEVDFQGINVATINELRFAFQLQKLYEKDARGGTRYIEILKSHFGVTSPDARLQRPEYLGGNRKYINVNQVIQQSETAGTPQGNVAAYSLTADTNHDFTKSFVEHGFVIGLMVARYDHTYQQGIERMWSRKSRFDYYWPVFANIGEQAIKNKEIYAQGTSEDDEVFGYQEAWSEYRYKPSRVSGEMRSQYAQSLDVWHLADYYSELPKLSPEWIVEDKTNVDRVIAVSSRLADQLFGDIYVENITTRPMPMYSIPGLIDHH